MTPCARGPLQVYAGTSQVGSAFVEGGFNEDIFHKDLSDSDDEGPPRVVAVVSSNASTCPASGWGAEGGF